MPNSDLLDSALNQRPFPQAQFLSEQGFSSFLRDRGLNIHSRDIRQLVRSGVVDTLYDDPPYYHPFQVWPISQFLKKLEIRLQGQFSHCGLNVGTLKRSLDLNFSHRMDDIQSFLEGNDLAEFRSRVLPFLLWIEQYYLPIVHGSRAGFVTLTNCDGSEWHEWKRTTPPSGLLKDFDIDLNEVVKWHRRILFDANAADPFPDLYLLLRSMPYEKRKRFKGSVRLAHDLYELAEMLRFFVEENSDQSMVKEWDPRGLPDSPWMERLYGGQPRFGSPEFLRRLIREHGLDPKSRVTWLVEGDTEEGFIRQYVHRMGLERSFEFVTIRNFGGDDAFGRVIPAIQEDLRADRDEYCFVTLTFDESPRTRQRIDELVREGLVNFRFSVSNPEFELENFSIDELVHVATQWAAELDKEIEIDEVKLMNEVNDRLVRCNEPFDKAFNSVLHLSGQIFRLQKGSKWGKRLADLRFRKREDEARDGVYSEDSLFKIESQILAVLRGGQPDIDFLLSMDRIDVANLEISVSRGSAGLAD